MKTYIINLPHDNQRREYITNIVSKYAYLNYEILDAVYGKKLTHEETTKLFDTDTAFKRYGRELNAGEIGCTLSHFKIYNTLKKSEEPYALVLEDDITVIREFSIIEKMAKHLPNHEPWVLFLSADYWFLNRKIVNEEFSIAKVYDAVGTYAYIINQAGAELILSKNRKPSNVADNWSLYRRQGLNLYAAYPYMIDANIESFESSIEQSTFGENRRQMPLSMLIPAYWNAFVKKVLLKTGHFVSKIRK